MAMLIAPITPPTTVIPEAAVPAKEVAVVAAPVDAAAAVPEAALDAAPTEATVRVAPIT
jgi:hypothetical protein